MCAVMKILIFQFLDVCYRTDVTVVFRTDFPCGPVEITLSFIQV